MSQPTLRVCLVSPMPPPYGGVANWVLLLLKYASSRDDLQIDCINTEPRWRAVDDLAIWKRVLGGGVQLVRDYARFLRILRRRPDVVHLNTSALLAVVRDLLMLWTARRKHIPSVYHLRFGRITKMATQGTWEWRMLVRAMRLATIVIALDLETEETLRKQVPKIRIARVPNAVDLEVFPAKQTPVGQRTVTFLGWVIPTKGVAEFVTVGVGQRSVAVRHCGLGVS